MRSCFFSPPFPSSTPLHCAGSIGTFRTPCAAYLRVPEHGGPNDPLEGAWRGAAPRHTAGSPLARPPPKSTLYNCRPARNSPPLRAVAPLVPSFASHPPRELKWAADRPPRAEPPPRFAHCVHPPGVPVYRGTWGAVCPWCTAEEASARRPHQMIPALPLLSLRLGRRGVSLPFPTLE